MSWLSTSRSAARALAQTPASTLLALANLTLGIAASTAIFSLLYGVVLAPLPFAEARSLVRLCEEHETTASFCVASVPNTIELGRRSRSLEALGAARQTAMLMRTSEGVETIPAVIATPGFLHALALRATLGRLLEDDDMGADRPRVAVLTDSFWRSWAGADPAILGRTLSLDGQVYAVVGVLPPVAVPELDSAKVWTAIPFDPLDEEARGWRGFLAVARLADGTSRRQAQQELGLRYDDLATAHPDSLRGWKLKVVSLHDRVVGSVRGTLLFFMGAVLLVLLIACTNVASILFARAASRQRDVAVRSSLGATRGHLLAQLMAESLLLSLAAGALGLLLASVVIRVFLALAPAGIPRLQQVGMPGPVLAFALFASLLTSVLSGLWPALRGSRLDLARYFRESGSVSRQAGRTRAGAALVALEVALALPLLIGAGLLTQSLVSARGWSGGIRGENLLTLWLLPLDSKYPERRQVAELYHQAEQAVGALPFVAGVGAASAGPLFGGRETESFALESAADRPITARWFDVGASYFQALGVELRRGRHFNAGDAEGTTPVAIVNEAFARQLFGEGDPIGKRVLGKEEHTVAMEIVGVVADVPPLSPGAAAEPEIYWPYAQQARWATFLVVRTSGDPATHAAAIRARLRQLDPDLDVRQPTTFRELKARRLANPRFQMSLINAFAVVAILLVVGGIYGVVSQGMARRTREIGLRMALGASRESIFRQMFAYALSALGLGIAVGLPAAMLSSRLWRSMLYGIGATDGLTFLTGALALLLVGALAAFVPVRRATRLDPVEALKHEG